MRNFFSGAFKDNKNISYGFLTGILRIAQESIFSGLNNLTVNSVMDDAYDNYFGFTSAEIHEMLDYYQKLDKEDELKQWYNGYLFGNEENYVLPVQSLQEPDELTKHFRWLVGHEKEIKDHLEKIMPEYISKAYSGKMALDKLVR